MKLLREISEEVEISMISESNSMGAESKRMYIKGVFAQAETKNKNGRIYPSSIMESQVNTFNESAIKTKRSMGELGHPDTPSINLDRASHLITKLEVQGKNVYGEAKILNTPCGKIAQGLLEDGVQLAVSTRGCGTTSSKAGANYVNGDFVLSTIDIVADPSAPDAFVNSMMESQEWILTEGVWTVRELEQEQEIIHKTDYAALAEAKISAFQRFLTRLEDF